MTLTFRGRDDDERRLEAREFTQHRGRWSGGVYLPVDQPENRRRPSLIAQVLRSMSEIRSPVR